MSIVSTPTPPSFPTVAELLQEQEDEQRAASPRGFFQELLLGHPEALHIDALEHPERYDERTMQLLQELSATRRRGLTLEERGLLDKATLDFATAPPKPPPAPVKRQNAAAPKRTAAPVARALPGVDVPVTEMPPFWWL